MAERVENCSSILITGGSGFVGSHLLRRLAAATPDLIIRAVQGPTGTSDLPRVDLSDATATEALVSSVRPQTIVHLGAQSSVGDGAKDPDALWSTNFDGTRALAVAARRVGREEGRTVRMVFASSAEVYGARFNDGPCTEDAPIAPASVYGRTKAACEFILSDLADDSLNVIALRLFNHTGPGQDARFIVPALARRVAELPPGKPGTIITGDLLTQRDFSDISDIVDAYLAVILQPSPSSTPFQVFNIGSGKARTMQSIFDHLARLHGAPVRAQLDPRLVRGTEIRKTIGRFEAVERAYSWKATRDFDDTIGRILNYERERLRQQ